VATALPSAKDSMLAATADYRVRRPITTHWSTTRLELGNFWRGELSGARRAHELVVAGAAG
jgi:hypothetical protein